MFFSRVAQSPPVTSPGHYEGRVPSATTQDGLRLIVSEASGSPLALETRNLALLPLVQGTEYGEV